MLQQANLASLGQTAAGVAHEINNPLAFVTNNITLLKREVTDLHDILRLYQQAETTLGAYRHDLLERIRTLSDEVDLPFVQANLDGLLDRSREGLKRIQKIVENLRDFAHLEEAESQEADLSAGVTATVSILHELAARRHVTLETELENVPKLNCYPAKINMVIQNLVVNAIDACSAGGTVVVRTRAREEAVEIEVADDGCGIDSAIQGKVFDPFFTTKPVGQGTGLGLSMSYGIIKDHGGSIDFESETGRGTRFTCVIPFSEFAVCFPDGISEFPGCPTSTGAGMTRPASAISAAAPAVPSTSAVDLRHAISDNLDNCHFLATALTTEHPWEILGAVWTPRGLAGRGGSLDLLGRARSLFKGRGTTSVAKVQYYSVVCPLGHRLRGQRTGGYQALRCPSCGEGIFVLPASPLPEPVPPERSARVRTAIVARPDVDEGPIELKDPAQVTLDIGERDDVALEAEIIWDDDLAGESPPTPDGGEGDEVDRAGPEEPASQPAKNDNSRSRPGDPDHNRLVPGADLVRPRWIHRQTVATDDSHHRPAGGCPTTAGGHAQSRTEAPCPAGGYRCRARRSGPAANSSRVRPPSHRCPDVRRLARGWHIGLSELAATP